KNAPGIKSIYPRCAITHTVSAVPSLNGYKTWVFGGCGHIRRESRIVYSLSRRLPSVCFYGICGAQMDVSNFLGSRIILVSIMQPVVEISLMVSSLCFSDLALTRLCLDVHRPE